MTAVTQEITVLVADDHAVVRAGIRHILESMPGVAVVAEATDGPSALRLAREQRPDVIILDVSMPGLSGYEVCRKIRQGEKTRDLPVIFLTAKGMLVDMTEGEEAGSDLYLVKPVLATKLLNMVGMFLSDDTPLAKKRRTAPTQG